MISDKDNPQSPSWPLPVCVALMIPTGLFLPRPLGLGMTWLVVAILMLGALGVAGLCLGKGSTGVLIDPKTNTMSLSRFQIVLWTWVVLSAFVTLALARVWDSRDKADMYKPRPRPAVANEEVTSADPLDIEIPPLLWALMGISLTSAVGAPLLKAAKAQRTMEQEQTNQQRAAMTGSPQGPATYRAVLEQRIAGDAKLAKEVGETEPLGAVVRKKSWNEAAFSDMVTGEEVSTFGYVDIAKVQNLFFTLVAIVAYAVAIGSTMSGSQPTAALLALPAVPAGLVTIIGISHAGYLVDKAPTHSTPVEQAKKP